jgi:hypothetical protein
MNDTKQPRAYIEGQHLEYKSTQLSGFSVAVHYNRTQADLHILLPEPLSTAIGVPEIVRLELRSLIEALEQVAESSSDISFGQAPRS